MVRKILGLVNFAILIISARVAATTGDEKCSKKSSIDITNGLLLDDGSIMFNGVIFPPKYIYEVNTMDLLDNTTNGVAKKFGCICKLKNCFRKCCKLKFVINKTNGECIYLPNEDLIGKEGLTFVQGAGRFPDLESNKTVRVSELALVTGFPSGKVYLEKQFSILREDGKLFIETPHNVPPWILKTADEYCVDTFILEKDDGTNITKFDALVCFATDKEGNSYTMNSTCMLISCVFLLATLAVYAWLPELRNLHGRVLMAYLFSVLLAFGLLAFMQISLLYDYLQPQSCAVMTIFIYFFLMSAFFWLNTMCFDIWWTFSGKRGMSLEKLSIRGRFYAYAAYSYGIPLMLTVLLAFLEFSGLPARPWMPLLRTQGCFLYGNAKLLYMYGPILILCIANLIFFILTAIKIAKVNRQTSVLKSRDSQTHDSHRNDKQRLLLYVKLFTVMGINWFLEIASGMYPEDELFWKVTDAYNVLIGVIIFIIFVCKRKIWALMKKRFKQRQGESMSRTQTSSSRLSNRDDLQMDKVNGK